MNTNIHCPKSIREIGVLKGSTHIMNTNNNPYKGVKNGDPRLRAANTKKNVEVSFICAVCKKKKKAVIRDGSTRRFGLPCTECRNKENREKNRILEAERETERREREAAFYRMPQRTDEELSVMLEQSKNLPKHDCDECGKSFFVCDESLPFINDQLWRENSIPTVRYTSDPFLEEIRGVIQNMWMCDGCYEASADEI